MKSNSVAKGSWMLEELSNALDVDQATIRQAVSTWIKHSVLHEARPNNFVLLEEAADLPLDADLPEAPAQRPCYSFFSRRRKAYAIIAAVIEEQAPVLSAVQQQEAEQIRVYWKFIEGMLTNLGAMSLDRIQTMLKLAPGYRRSIEQLGVFMETARREGFVTVSNGIWKLNK